MAARIGGGGGIGGAGRPRLYAVPDPAPPRAVAAPRGGAPPPDDARPPPAGGPPRARMPAQEAGPARDGPPEAEADPEEVARGICLRMLTRRPCTRAELATELRRRQVPAEAAEAVLGRFDDVGLVDDRAFAAAWVDRQRRTRGLSRRALAAELRQKGVAPEDVNEAVAVVSDDEERARAAALVARKLPSVRSLDRDRQVSRLVGMLARKGYGAGIAYAVVREALAADAADLPYDTDDP